MKRKEKKEQKKIRKTRAIHKKIRSEISSKYVLTHRFVAQYLRCLKAFEGKKVRLEDIEKVLREIENEGLFKVGNIREFVSVLSRFALVEVITDEKDRRRKYYIFKKPQDFIKEDIEKIIKGVKQEIENCRKRIEHLEKSIQGWDLI